MASSVGRVVLGARRLRARGAATGAGGRRRGWRARGSLLLARCDVTGSERTGPGKTERSWSEEDTSTSTSSSSPNVVECYGVGMDVECEIVGEEEAPVGEAPSAEVSPWQAALGVLSLTSPFFFWGTSMVAMKFEAIHTTPLFLGSMRLVPAGAALLVWSKAFASEERRKIDVIPRKAEDWAKIVTFAFVDGTCFQGFLAEGIQRTGAGLGSIIIDSQPISVAIMAALFLGEKVSTKTAVGLAVGVLGLATLELPTSVWSELPLHLPGAGVPTGPGLAATGGEVGDLGGELLMLLAAQSMAVGTILVRWVCKTIDPVVATGWHMILGGLPLLAIAAATETELPQRLEGLAGSDFLVLSYITLLGGAASYGIFFVNANKGNLTKLSSLTFLTPVFACFFGNLLLQETFNASQVVGAGITLLGILLVTVELPSAREEGKAE
ncbi:WAT1-related protein [Chloropicon primus]|uniref:EamA domain-containing protein n=2 Tax=Chloropicon primus TaxID=1764295 RepID=A0A5B8MJ67_9CHLO|nr:hypothetical protein A3770_04p30540 [Chloropicon primus]UPQ99748.1 WAT1-related protein [Chloropicon primus]|eukprot:QDZ20536.1 hypothetical protein A3770_04p30540 [Chloropicon primus]